MKLNCIGMKSVAVILTGFFASQAHASYYQTYCSNAEGTLRQAHGHSANFFEATNRKWTNAGPVYEKVALEGVLVESINSQELEKESSNTCTPGASGGVASWREVTYAKVKISKEDGSLFPETILGVSNDRKTIEASWICENNGDSMVACPEQ